MKVHHFSLFDRLNALVFCCCTDSVNDANFFPVEYYKIDISLYVNNCFPRYAELYTMSSIAQFIVSDIICSDNCDSMFCLHILCHGWNGWSIWIDALTYYNLIQLNYICQKYIYLKKLQASDMLHCIKIVSNFNFKKRRRNGY